MTLVPARAQRSDIEWDSGAPIASYRVLAQYPHDEFAYTQGLTYFNDHIYEGTGQYGRSDLRVVDLESGEILKQHRLSAEVFGEGVARVGDKVYQITWQSETAFVYDLATFEQLETFSYTGQGWGLTAVGGELAMSNGSNVIRFRDPDTFESIRTIAVFDGDQPIDSLNELEYIDGEIWANVYQTDLIARIDPESGRVISWVDLTGLLPIEFQEDDRIGVLNGIAYDIDAGRIFVTGKYWPLLFEIEVVESA